MGTGLSVQLHKARYAFGTFCGIMAPNFMIFGVGVLYDGPYVGTTHSMLKGILLIIAAIVSTLTGVKLTSKN